MSAAQTGSDGKVHEVSFGNVYSNVGLLAVDNNSGTS